MFKNQPLSFQYAPVLSLSPAEMNAIQELPQKDKKLILPIIPIRGWVGSQHLENSEQRVRKAIGDNPWIADIDSEFLENKKGYNGEYPRPVFQEIEALLSPENGYLKWYQYIKSYKNVIPTLQLDDLHQLTNQIKLLDSLNRGILVRLKANHITNNYPQKIASEFAKLRINNVMFLFDFGQINGTEIQYSDNIATQVLNVNSIIPKIPIAISSSSFPNGFANYYNGENQIHERLLFNKVKKLCKGINLIYSDRGSARAEKISGGGGIPAPRIDYPLKNDWRFIRKTLDFPESQSKEDRLRLYSQIAKEIIASNYWEKDLHLWGTQVIELTAKQEKMAIDSPMRATAVRINIHLFNQLHYNTEPSEYDTDEDWED